MTYSCKKCGANYNIPDRNISPGGSTFKCTRCGTPFVLRNPSASPPSGSIPCPHCGGFNGPLARFCAHCGNPLARGPYAAGYSGQNKGSNPGIIAATIIAVVIVGIAVVGILAAIAIPAFLGQREKARMRALEGNFNTAIYYVQDELGRCGTAPDTVTTDAVADLNAFDAFNPWAPETDAYSTSLGNGQVAISKTDLRALCGTDEVVAIIGDEYGDGIADQQLEYFVQASNPGKISIDPAAPDARGQRPGQIDL